MYFLGFIMTAVKPKVNYLNNKELLKEIHKSKCSYCWVKSDKNDAYFMYDIIVNGLEEITQEVIDTAITLRLHRLNQLNFDATVNEWRATGSKGPKPKLAKCIEKAAITVEPEDVVYRVMTFSHIPEDLTRKNKPKTEADVHSKCNFPPYKHYIFKKDKPKEVGRSHWQGDLRSGKFCVTHGKITERLAKMFLKLCERYSMRSNWRGYTYVDEMRGQALLQLSQIALQFNESKSQNPFAYYTAAITNSFTRILNLEKRNQNIRDDLLQHSGQMPSFTRQTEHTNKVAAARAAAANPTVAKNEE